MDNRVSNFRLFLHNISEELGSDELESLKFLCHDTLTKARLEKIKNTKELFVAIGEVREDEEKQLDLLQQLFINIRRLDLVSKVEKFQQTKKGEINKHAPLVASQHVEDKPFEQPSSGVSSLNAYASPFPISEEYYAMPQTTQQHSDSRYQAQYSIPFGEEEQSSPKDQSSPNSHSTANKLLKDPQSSPNSFGEENTGREELPKDDKIELDLSQSLSSSMSILASQETSRDSGQHNAQNGTLDNRDPVRPGRQSWTDGSIPHTSSEQHKNISQPCAEKVPVERVMSNYYHDEAAQHLNKCPVEMNYNCISKYFNRDGKNLGKGGFGIVYEGIQPFHGRSVVIKEEYASHLEQASSAAQLQREKRVGYIKHPHLMPLYAYCEEKRKPRCLMYPKMHSDLRKALRNDEKGQQRLSWENRVRIALHTARALRYLHTEVTNERNVRQEIVHMDVKPGNIFLDEDFNARLGDPGMAQELPMEYSYASISQFRGTDGYMDEYLKDRHLKPVNDVFSFGVVLLELLTQRKAMEQKPPKKTVPLCRLLKEEGVLSDPERLMEKARQGVWPVNGDDKRYTKEFAAIAIGCLERPDRRAKLSDVCKRLEEILERKGVNKVSKPKEGDHCVSCLLNFPAKYLGVKSIGCDSDITQQCNYFCVTCLLQARRNPLECPSHGPAESPIGGSDVYAVLVCGNDPSSPKNAAIFQRDLLGFKSVLTDNRIVGVRNDHVFSIMPSTSCGVSQADLVRQELQELRQRLQGKKDVFLYFYFSGHSDQNGNLLCYCSSEEDVLREADLKEEFRHLNVNEFLIILDCCFADGKIASEYIKDDNFLVYKSPAALESAQHPLESLYVNLQETVSHEDSLKPIPNVSEELPQTGSDTLDGNVFTKVPLRKFTIRQWSSSLSHEVSYAKAKGSFLTQFIICGLRGAQKCQFSNCASCSRFKAKAKSLGYISAANLEDFISNHVENAASSHGGLRQTPRMRTVHSKETILAFYNEEILCDEILFRSTSGISERINIDDFPLSLSEFQKLVYYKVQGHLPSCAQLKHIQILCDDQEIDTTSYVDLQEFVRQGYDVKSQLRPCSDIANGPVVIEIQKYKNEVITLLTSLQLTRNQQDPSTFEIDTSKRACGAEDVKDCLEDEPTLSDLRETTVASSIIVILTQASLYSGHLAICVLDDSLDCTFTNT